MSEDPLKAFVLSYTEGTTEESCWACRLCYTHFKRRLAYKEPQLDCAYYGVHRGNCNPTVALHSTLPQQLAPPLTSSFRQLVNSARNPEKDKFFVFSKTKTFSLNGPTHITVWWHI
jgi:hypothetical protein